MQLKSLLILLLERNPGNGLSRTMTRTYEGKSLVKKRDKRWWHLCSPDVTPYRARHLGELGIQTKTTSPDWDRDPEVVHDVRLKELSFREWRRTISYWWYPGLGLRDSFRIMIGRHVGKGNCIPFLGLLVTSLWSHRLQSPNSLASTCFCFLLLSTTSFFFLWGECNFLSSFNLNAISSQPSQRNHKRSGNFTFDWSL